MFSTPPLMLLVRRRSAVRVLAAPLLVPTIETLALPPLLQVALSSSLFVPCWCCRVLSPSPSLYNPTYITLACTDRGWANKSVRRRHRRGRSKPSSFQRPLCNFFWTLLANHPSTSLLGSYRSLSTLYVCV